MTTNNDQIILDQIVKEEHAKRAPNSRYSQFFELFTAEQVLKNYDLSEDEIEYGLAGSSLDGGVDAVYTFANGELVQDDFDSSGLKRNVLLEVVLVQSKTSSGFGEETLNKLIAVTEHLFSLANSLTAFEDRYNDGLLSAVALFRNLYTSIAGRFPELRFRYVYATRGDSNAVHPNVRAKATDLELKVKQLFGSARFEMLFIGASDLLALARRQPKTTYTMQFAESLIGDKGYVTLVRLDRFFSLVSDENSDLRKELFEANVRDYQGRTQVNEEMQQTLVGRGPVDFWWLNNGVTIVATKATQTGKSLTMEDPQIVNGQQTSTEIFQYFRHSKPQNEDRSVMVRVIVVEDASARDRIIKATNSQTAIPPASLRATDKIQRHIEEYLRPQGIFYDRRKNSQKQQGRPAESIISISLLAQALMAILLGRPSDARARPSSLIKREDDYTKLFNDDWPIDVYLFAARLVRKVQAHLRGIESLVPKDRNNLLFYVAMYAAAMLIEKWPIEAQAIAERATQEVPDHILEESLMVIWPIYEKLGATDQVAKGTELANQLKKRLSKEYSAHR